MLMAMYVHPRSVHDVSKTPPPYATTRLRDTLCSSTSVAVHAACSCLSRLEKVPRQLKPCSVLASRVLPQVQLTWVHCCAPSLINSAKIPKSKRDKIRVNSSVSKPLSAICVA